MARFDLVVVGGGPAGLSAAAVAARHGASVCLVEQSPDIGGQVWRNDVRSARPNVPAPLLKELRGNPCITTLRAAQVIAANGHRHLLVAREGEERAQALEYKGLVLATGARELMLPFPGWTLPGVTGAGGLQALIKGGVPVAGQRVVVAGTGPLLWACADTVVRSGGNVVAIVESASARQLAGFAAGLWRNPGKLIQGLGFRARLAHSRILAGSKLLRAFGDERIKGIEVRQGARSIEIRCDRMAYGLGLIANPELGMALGCRTIADGLAEVAIAVDERQQTSIPDVYAAGECTGSRGAELAAIEGAIAGLAFVGRFDPSGSESSERRRWRVFSQRVGRCFAVDRQWASEVANDELVCRCEDVAFSAVRQFANWGEAKMVTRCGMGPCQGRFCGATTRALLGWGPTSVRRPLSPTSLGVLGGQGGQDND